MTAIEITILVLFGGIPLVIGIGCLMFFAIEDIVYKKYKKKFPELFELIKTRNEQQLESSKFYNRNIWVLKNKVDKIIEDQKYMSKENLEKSNQEVEELKKQIEMAEIVYKQMNIKEQISYEKISEIIKSDKKLLKNMQKYGWCKDEND